MLTKILKYVSTLDEEGQAHFTKILLLHFSEEKFKFFKYFALVFKYFGTRRFIFRLTRSYMEAVELSKIPRITLEPLPHWSHENKMGYYNGVRCALQIGESDVEEINWNAGTYCGFVEYIFVKYGYISSLINNVRFS